MLVQLHNIVFLLLMLEGLLSSCVIVLEFSHVLWWDNFIEVSSEVKSTMCVKDRISTSRLLNPQECGDILGQNILNMLDLVVKVRHNMPVSKYISYKNR